MKFIRVFFLLVTVAVVCSFSVASSADKQTVPKFKNVHEAIDWVKAKGDCEKSRCVFTVQLHTEKVGSSEWRVWALLSAIDFDRLPKQSAPGVLSKLLGSGFSVEIRRMRVAALSANTSVRVLKRSQYYFDADGKLSDVYAGFSLEKLKGDPLLDFSVPTNSFKHGDGATDYVLFGELGIGWDF